MSDLDEIAEGTSLVRRIITALVALLVIGGGSYALYWFFFSDSSDNAVVSKPEEVTVARGNLVSSFTTTGVAQATLTSKLTFSTSGQVKSVSVGVGDKITAGQELARLDDKDAQRKLESAAANLATAQIRLQQLQQGPTTADIAAGQQSVAGAQSQLANAQSNLDKAQRGPTATDLATADAAVTQAELSLQNTTNSINTAWIALLNAQRTYCTTSNIPGTFSPCQESDLPLSDYNIDQLTGFIRAPGDVASKVGAATSAATSLLQSNTSYLNSKNSVIPAQNNLDIAKLKRKALNDPPNPLDLAQLQASVVSAQAGVTTAQARLDTLLAGSTSTDVSLQQQSVKIAQIAYQQASDAVDALVLRAAFDGVIGAASVNVGDQVGAATVAFTLSNPNGVRVDLTVSESDLAGLKAGQFGIATFDAFPGQLYLVKITGVSTTPTVAQGVVTYPVQALILRGADLAANAADLQKVATALGSLAGGRTGAGAGTGGGGGAGAQGSATAGAGRTPGAGGGGGGGAGAGTPAAGRTPGAGGAGAGGAGGAGAGGAGAGAAGTQALQALLGAALPSAGMNASVTVILDIKENALLVPSAAVKRQGRTSFVYVPGAGGKPEQKTVTVGGTDTSKTVILTGLNEGDIVLLNVTLTGQTPTAQTTTTAGGFGPGFGGPTPAGGVR